MDDEPRTGGGVPSGARAAETRLIRHVFVFFHGLGACEQNDTGEACHTTHGVGTPCDVCCMTGLAVVLKGDHFRQVGVSARLQWYKQKSPQLDSSNWMQHTIAKGQASPPRGICTHSTRQAGEARRGPRPCFIHRRGRHQACLRVRKLHA